MVVISPHLDDAVLSLGQHIINWKRENKKILIVTVFTDFGKENNFPKYSREYIAKSGFETLKGFKEARIKEDAEAMEELGVEYEHWGYVDAGFRKNNKVFCYPTKKILLKNKIVTSEEKMIDELSKKIRKIKTRKILIPYGVGGHVDHFIVKKAGENIVGEKMFYLESPYLWEDFNFSCLLKKIFKIKSFLIRIDEKNEILGKYKSQYPLWKKVNLYFEVVV